MIYILMRRLFSLDFADQTKFSVIAVNTFKVNDEDL